MQYDICELGLQASAVDKKYSTSVSVNLKNIYVHDQSQTAVYTQVRVAVVFVISSSCYNLIFFYF